MGNVKKNNVTTQSSNEQTESLLSLDFERMDRERTEELSEYSKLVGANSNISRVDDQRRRLESFLSLARQAKSKKDITRIKGMI